MRCTDKTCSLNMSGVCLGLAWASFCECPAYKEYEAMKDE